MTQLTLSHQDVGMLIYSEVFQARTPSEVETCALQQAKGPYIHLFKQWSLKLPYLIKHASLLDLLIHNPRQNSRRAALLLPFFINIVSLQCQRSVAFSFIIHSTLRERLFHRAHSPPSSFTIVGETNEKQTEVQSS